MNRGIAALLLATLLGGMSATAGVARAEDYPVGVFESMTNTYSWAGVPLTNGARLAADEINASGILGAGNRIVLIVEDGASDRAQAAVLANKFANDPRILAALGPTSSIDALATGPITNQAKLPLITVSPLQNALDIGPYMFRMTVAAQDYMTQLADYFFDHTKATNCAFVTVANNVAFIAQHDAVRADLEKRGGKVLADITIQAGDTDFAPITTKIVSLAPNCLALNVPVEQSANIIIQAKQMGLPKDVQILGNNASATAAFIKAGGPAVEGAYVISEFTPPGFTEQARAFAVSYTKRFGDTPDNFAAIGYSKVQLLADAIRRAQPNPTREKIRDALASTSNLPIVAGGGRLSIGADRVTHYDMSVLTVRDGKFVIP